MTRAHGYRVLHTAIGLLALAALAAGLSGCRGDALVDERNIYYIRGMKLREQKNHEEAAEAFQTCLRLSPQSGQAHLQLALLYDEPLNDPLVAVYHYRRFLEMRPDDPNAEAAKEWLAKAEQKLLQRLQQAAVYAAINQGGGAPLSESAGASARELALLSRLQELNALNEELRKRQDEPVIDPNLLPPVPAATDLGPVAAVPVPASAPTAPVAVLPAPSTVSPFDAVPPVVAAPPVGVPPPPPTAAAKPITPAPTAAVAGTTRTHIVAKGDTLSNLSRRYYGNVSYWPQLKQANRDILGDKDELKLGTKLRIPPVAQFKTAAAPAARKTR